MASPPRSCLPGRSAMAASRSSGSSAAAGGGSVSSRLRNTDTAGKVYPVSDTYAIRLGYGRDTYPQCVRVSLLIWAGNSRTETFQPSRLDTAQPNWLTPPRGVQIGRPPATSLRPRWRQGAPATATKSCTRPPATSPRVPRRRRRAAPGDGEDEPRPPEMGRMSCGCRDLPRERERRERGARKW